MTNPDNTLAGFTDVELNEKNRTVSRFPIESCVV